jgi:fatty acid-binding protein DegV
MDSQTLAGPLRYLARKAVALKEQKLTMEQIKQRLHRCIESSVSFVIPEDFEFLKRSGRLAPFAAKVGGALKLLPVLTQGAQLCAGQQVAAAKAKAKARRGEV